MHDKKSESRVTPASTAFARGNLITDAFTLICGCCPKCGAFMALRLCGFTLMQSGGLQPISELPLTESKTPRSRNAEKQLLHQSTIALPGFQWRIFD
jgi:hypothetical protein